MESTTELAFAPVLPDVRLDIYRGEEWITAFANDVHDGLAGTPRTLPPKYFYDARGSELFDRITEQPEYYPTRTETSILNERGSEIIEHAGVSALVELGSGSSIKTELLLAPMIERCERLVAAEALYMPIDVSESAVRAAAVRLVDDYPGLRVHGVIGDFEKHLGGLPHVDARLFAFLGGTIGNFTPQRMKFFMRRMRTLMQQSDRMLIGIDLVKPVDEIEAAYNDSAGVTAEFNKNILTAINQNLRGNFAPEQFEHVAFFDRDNSWIEMRLRAACDQAVRIGAVGLDLVFEAGDEIRTEISRKFSRQSFEHELTATGIAVDQWYSDTDERFALVLVKPE
ncbi:MAG: L-histidine N(alpha)-methyltransferase [Thermoleophilaceae bacterium]|nr:L-histidine N(alpha)-methyltransferase [Thermoleophilaceae bacterium]